MNNSKRAYQPVKDLTTVKQGKTLISKTAQENTLQNNEVLNQWTEYCSELYNCKTNGDPSVLNCP